jgi:hypothetical protein
MSMGCSRGSPKKTHAGSPSTVMQGEAYPWQREEVRIDSTIVDISTGDILVRCMILNISAPSYLNHLTIPKWDTTRGERSKSDISVFGIYSS